ncbi:MAG: universal stress protein [Candidatus Solibacter sp.]|nr:universal stress protein [Candidatus Solibacter sp.]
MRILIAVSGSNDGSSDPVAAAASIPWPEGTEFRVLTVVEGVHPPVAQLLEGARDVSDVQHTADNIAANTVASAVAQLQSRGLNADGASPEGDPKSMIADHAKEWGADLIVVGSCDKSRLETFFVGSVSRSVVERASCSVLVARAGLPRN